jgi:dipeptidase E
VLLAQGSSRAYENDIVLSGLSAGAICWFKYGSSDSRKFKNPQASLIKIRGLNFINALCCPHYDSEEDRKEHAKILMSKTPGIAIALDNCSALECVNDQYRIIASKSEANAYRVYWLNGTYHEEIIQKTPVFLPLVNLFNT